MIRGTRSDREWWVMDRSLEGLQGEGLVSVLPCPLRLGSGEYSDFIHLNAEGQERYSRWLLETLAMRRDHDLD
jgi:hypothetical protein